MSLKYQDVIELFNCTFADSENTILVRGEDEPVYLPAKTTKQKHQIVFAHGYYASALHEIAHWCIAGRERRQLEDYGYWYCPDGRDEYQQAKFEEVEIKPQAIEWAFSCAVGKAFRVSLDNLDGVPANTHQFQRLVRKQVSAYLKFGFPERAEIFVKVLQNHYRTNDLNEESFEDDNTEVEYTT